MSSIRVLTLAALFLLLQGCTHIGPSTIKRDRFDYNSAISGSWKEQTLLNIVKLRYADMPVFVEVASVVSGYQLEGSVSVGGTGSSPGAVQGDFLQFGSTGKYIDRPTITYRPITGQQFNRSFMIPIPPGAVLFLLQTGWSASLVFPMTVDAVNGQRAQYAGGLQRRAGDSAYYRTVQLLDELQRSGAVGMHVKKKGKEDTTVLFFYQDNLPAATKDKLKELYSGLNLDPSRGEFNVVYGNVPKNDGEVALSTLSMLQILVKLATLVDIPPEDVQSGSTIETLNAAELDSTRRAMRIRQGLEKPAMPFVAVRYRDRWFWIEDTDFASKRAFTFLMILFSLTETGGTEGLPLVTIPAG